MYVCIYLFIYLFIYIFIYFTILVKWNGQRTIHNKYVEPKIDLIVRGDKCETETRDRIFTQNFNNKKFQSTIKRFCKNS